MSDARPAARLSARDRLALAVLCAAQFVLVVDVVVVNVALPSLRSSLDLPDAQLALPAVAYTLTFGSLLVVAGRAGDAWGRRRAFCVGLALFTAASLLAGLAQDAWQLFAARALQGVGAAVVSPNALALVLSRFDDTSRRNAAMGVWAAVGSAGAVAGQLLGGLVVDALGWRWVFFLNVPVGVAATVVALVLLTESRAPSGRLDVGGAALLVGGLAPAVLALAWVPSDGLDGRVVGAAAAAAVLLTAFSAQQRRSHQPLVPARLLRAPGVVVGNVTLAVSAATVGASLFFTTLYLQDVLGHSALAVGLAFAPITVLIMVLAPQAARRVSTVGARPLLVAGLLATAVGTLALSRMEPDGSYVTDVLPPLLVIAVGSALSYGPMFISATGAVAAEDQGAASGLVSTAQELGPAVGLAAIAAVAAAATSTSSVAARVDGYRTGLVLAAALAAAAAVVATRLPAGLGKALEEEEGVLTSP